MPSLPVWEGPKTNAVVTGSGIRPETHAIITGMGIVPERNAIITGLSLWNWSVNGECHVTEFICQRLSLATVCGKAQSVTHTGSPSDKIYYSLYLLATCNLSLYCICLIYKEHYYLRLANQ